MSENEALRLANWIVVECCYSSSESALEHAEKSIAAALASAEADGVARGMERANTILVEMSNGIADVREAFVSIAGSDTPNAVGLKIQMKTLDAASEKIRAAARALERRPDVEKKPKT